MRADYTKWCEDRWNELADGCIALVDDDFEEFVMQQVRVNQEMRALFFEKFISENEALFEAHCRDEFFKYVSGQLDEYYEQKREAKADMEAEAWGSLK